MNKTSIVSRLKNLSLTDEENILFDEVTFSIMECVADQNFEKTEFKMSGNEGDSNEIAISVTKPMFFALQILLGRQRDVEYLSNYNNKVYNEDEVKITDVNEVDIKDSTGTYRHYLILALSYYNYFFSTIDLSKYEHIVLVQNDTIATILNTADLSKDNDSKPLLEKYPNRVIKRFSQKEFTEYKRSCFKQYLTWLYNDLM